MSGSKRSISDSSSSGDSSSESSSTSSSHSKQKTVAAQDVRPADCNIPHCAACNKLTKAQEALVRRNVAKIPDGHALQEALNKARAELAKGMCKAKPLEGSQRAFRILKVSLLEDRIKNMSAEVAAAPKPANLRNIISKLHYKLLDQNNMMAPHEIESETARMTALKADFAKHFGYEMSFRVSKRRTDKLDRAERSAIEMAAVGMSLEARAQRLTREAAVLAKDVGKLEEDLAEATAEVAEADESDSRRVQILEIELTEARRQNAQLQAMQQENVDGSSAEDDDE